MEFSAVMLARQALLFLFNYQYLAGRSQEFFVYHTGYLAWDDALSTCDAMGMELAYVSSAEENAALASIVTEPCWIGLSYDKEWHWSSGAEFAFSAWAPGEPNNYTGNEYCVEIDGDTWNDTPCDFDLISAFACRA